MIRLTLIVLFMSGCATLKSENSQYEFIKQKYDEKQFNLASYHILSFEGKFPESDKLCELWDLQIEIYKITGKEENNYLKNTKKNMSENCK